jgi:ectoine hydroxylase
MVVPKSLTRLRLFRFLVNLKHYYQLRKNAALYKKIGIDKKVWQPISYDLIRERCEGEGPWLDQPISEERIKQSPSFEGFSRDIQAQLLQWPEKGFLVVPGFFERPYIDEAEQSIEAGLSKKKQQEYRSNRLVNTYKTNPAINRIFRDSALLKLLSFILGKEIAPFQTLNFYRSGSQLAHSDAVHLTTAPLGYSIGVWVALEDIQPGCGEFFFYPGSHKLKYVMNSDYHTGHNGFKLGKESHGNYEKKIADIIREKALEFETFLPKKGDIIIWHANLLHGSLPIKDTSLTRKSLIMHYFAQGVLCFHEMQEVPAIF